MKPTMRRELCEHFGKTVPETNKQDKRERDCKTCSVPYWDLVALFYHQVLCVKKANHHWQYANYPNLLFLKVEGCVCLAVQLLCHLIKNINTLEL